MHQDHLQASEILLRQLAGHLKQVLYVYDPAADRFLYVSPAYKTIWETPVEDVMADPRAFTRLVHPDDCAVFWEAVRREHEEGEYFNLEYRIVTPSGRVKWIWSRNFPVIEENGTSNRTVGISEDITEKKAAEEQICKQKEQFELAVRGSNDGIFDWEIDTGRLFLSDRWKEQLGYSPDELDHKAETFNALLHKDDLERVWQHIKSYLKGDLALYDIEFRMRHKNGEYRWHRARGEALRDKTGRPYRMAGSHTDITEQKQREMALKETETLLSSIIDTLPGTLNVVDADFNILRFNHAEYRMKLLGENDRENIFGRKCYRVFMKRESPCPWCNIQKVLATGKPFQQTTTPDDPREKATGRAIHILLAPILTEDGKISGVVEYGVDVTELRDAKIRAEAASQSKSEFLANMSHEIRTPMNGVIGIAGLLLDTDLSDEQRRYAETILASAQSLLGLINDILDFSKIEAGKLDMENIDFDLRVLLDDVAEILGVKAREKGLAFCCQASPDQLPAIMGDPGRLRQVLMNLAGNAVKFTRKGEVVIQAELVLETDQEVVFRFTVRDTGIGIPENKQDRLFKKFSQADASISREHGGAGLGLAISKQLVEMMGGEIGVTSREGRGSEFWFTARFQRGYSPAKDAEPSRTKVVQKAPRRNKGFRVLLVEDNLTNQMVARGILEKLGVEVDAAANGTQALAALASTHYDLVFMDVQMPGMDGFEATRTIRRAGAGVVNPTVPIVAMTAHAMRGDQEKCLRAGMDDYISKPVSPDRLAAVMDKWLPKKARQQAVLPEDASPTDARADEAAIWDRASLSARVMDDAELMNALIELFLEDAPLQIDDLKSCVSYGDVAGAGAKAHEIKGMASNIGSLALKESACAVEKVSKTGDLKTLGALIPELEDVFGRLKARLKEYL